MFYILAEYLLSWRRWRERAQDAASIRLRRFNIPIVAFASVLCSVRLLPAVGAESVDLGIVFVFFVSVFVSVAVPIFAL